MTEPAFPVNELNNQTGHVCAQYLGITTRDYFAAKAMAALISTPLMHWPDVSKLPVEAPESVSEVAYALADAMLAVRSLPRKD